MYNRHISTSLHNKNLKKVRIEEMTICIMKAIYAKPISRVRINVENLKLFLLNQGQDMDM